MHTFIVTPIGCAKTCYWLTLSHLRALIFSWKAATSNFLLNEMQIHLLTTQKHALETSWFCFSLPQPAFYLAGPQCTVHDSLPAQGLHQGDEWSWAAPAVLLPGEGTRILRRWAPVSFSQAGPQTTQKSQLEKSLLKKKKRCSLRISSNVENFLSFLHLSAPYAKRHVIC